MTKKQDAEQKANWTRALSEGRVIRYTSIDPELGCEQYYFVAYQTVERAEQTLTVQQARIAKGGTHNIRAERAPTTADAATDVCNPQDRSVCNCGVGETSRAAHAFTCPVRPSSKRGRRVS